MTEETQDHGVADIKRIQEDDPDITKVKAWVNAGEKPGYSTVQGDFHQPAQPRGRFLLAPRNPAHLSAYDPTAEYFNPTADCGGSAEDPPVTCIIPPRVCGGFPMKSNDVIMIDRYSYLTHLVI